MIRVTLILQVLGVLALGVSHLALTDIWHGEGDLALEWRVLQASAVVLGTALVSSIVTLRRVPLRR